MKEKILEMLKAYPLDEMERLYLKTDAAAYTSKALKLGIAPIYWYNPMEWGDRSSGRWTYPVVKDALINAYNQHINN